MLVHMVHSAFNFLLREHENMNLWDIPPGMYQKHFHAKCMGVLSGGIAFKLCVVGNLFKPLDLGFSTTGQIANMKKW